MYIDRKTIESIENLFGLPAERAARFDMGAVEFENLKRSQKNGRSHDVTLFIRQGPRFIVIAKHFYPPGLYRAPSGGINPGEDFVSGAKREALEETGCEIELKHYIMKIEVSFCHDHDTVNWVSHIFAADYLSGDLRPIDVKEIREVRTADREEFPRFREIMLATSSGGLHYRAYLHDEVLGELSALDLK